MSNFPQTRLRRLRQSDWSRRLVRESTVKVDDLIWPIFVSASDEKRTPVSSMPGVDRLSIKEAVEDAKKARDLGIPVIALFPQIEPGLKTPGGEEALNEDGLVPQTIQAIKAAVPDIGLMADIALDPYTDHGHDGLIVDGEIVNDQTVDVLTQSALVFAAAGADIVAPSDMMDGRVGAIRSVLEVGGHTNTLIMAYAAKYASSFYGPFRDAVGSNTALKGDKRTYQMDPGNRYEALREVEMDISEGADMVMVKPGMPYLDIVRDVKEAFQMPTFAYQVSGEYAMIKAAGINGWVDEKAVMMESMMAFKRAGADGVLTYFALEIAKMLEG